LFIDKYIFTNEFKFNEGKLKLMCDLLRGDEELCGSIYKQLDSSCKSVGSSIFKKSIGGNIFKDRERKAVFETVDKFLELAFNKNRHKLPPLIPMYIEERFNRKKNKKLTDISGSELINIISKIQSKIDSNSQIMSIFEKEIYWDTPLFTAFKVALEKFCTDFKTNKKILLKITDGLANDTNDKFYTDKIYNSALTNDIILIGIYISEEKKMKIKYLYLI
jgi:hypothetical protein